MSSTGELRNPGALWLFLEAGAPSPEQQGICHRVGDKWLSVE